MKKNDQARMVLKKLLIFMLMCIIVLDTSSTAYAQSRKQTIENIKILVKQANQEKKKDGEISNKTARKLQKELKRIDDDNLISENKQADKGDVITLKGSSGGWKDLGYKGWKYRVDLPEHGGDSKPHVHVKGKSGKKIVEGVENVDGTPSHGKTLDDKKIPKKVRDKARNTPEYQKQKKGLKKMKRAKAKIEAKDLDLDKPNELLVAIAIVVIVVGFPICAPECLPALLAVV